MNKHRLFKKNVWKQRILIDDVFFIAKDIVIVILSYAMKGTDMNIDTSCDMFFSGEYAAWRWQYLAAIQ